MKEARDRQWRRRRRLLFIALIVLVTSAVTYGRFRPSGSGSSPPGLLSSSGIGSTEFGASKAQTVAALEARFGKPTWAGINSGCSPRYSEVVWNDLAVEFRDSNFSGYRYVAGGYLGGGTPATQEAKPIKPKITTGDGAEITLGSTLGQVAAAYGSLRRTGADKWKARNGLTFEDDAMRDPVPPSSRIIEIKIGTCGDF